MLYKPRSSVEYLFTHHTHTCPTCLIEFESKGRESAHHRTYIHFVKVHNMRIDLACHVKCAYRWLDLIAS